MNNLEELNELEKQIKDTQNLLNETVENKEKYKRSIQWNKILALLTIIFLSCTIWLFIKKNKVIEKEIAPDYTLVKTDSLINYKHYYFTKNLAANKTDIDNEKIIYHVQLGAFKNFNLGDINSDIKQYTDETDGLNKVTIGTFKKYKSAKKFQNELLKLGFKDCFLISTTFGVKNDIKDALALSNELQFLDQKQ